MHKMKKPWSCSRSTRPLWLALSLLLLLPGAAGADESRVPDETIIPGHFIDGKVQTNIRFSFHYSDESVRIRHEDGPETVFTPGIRVSFRRLCRDAASGLDYLFLTYWAGGRAPSSGQYWYVDAASRSVELAYSREQDHDMEIENDPHRWISYAGACGWREQQAAQNTRQEAFDALGLAGALPLAGDYEQGDSFTLPARDLAVDMVRDQLAALNALPAGERVVFSLAAPVGKADEQAWRVLQVTDPRRCPGRSTVLALDREASTWRSVYDYAGETHDCNVTRLADMRVTDGKLFAVICEQCSVRHPPEGYHRAWVEMDLRTNQSVLIGEPDFVLAPAKYGAKNSPERHVAECDTLNDLYNELNGTRDAMDDPWIRGLDCDDIRFPLMRLSE